MKKCSITGCDRAGLYAGGICTSHNNRRKKYGDPLAGPPIRNIAPKASPPADAFRHYMGDTPPGPEVCWRWKGSFTKYGYGSVMCSGVNQLAHRVAYETFNGPIPSGLVVRHICDNPPCVNPHHLLVGTVQDNQDDRAVRGRKTFGTALPQARLTEGDVRDVRLWARNGISQREIARRLGVGKTTIGHVISGDNWRHVT